MSSGVLNAGTNYQFVLAERALLRCNFIEIESLIALGFWALTRIRSTYELPASCVSGTPAPFMSLCLDLLSTMGCEG